MEFKQLHESYNFMVYAVTDHKFEGMQSYFMALIKSSKFRLVQVTAKYFFLNQ